MGSGQAFERIDVTPLFPPLSLGAGKQATVCRMARLANTQLDAGMDGHDEGADRVTSRVLSADLQKKQSQRLRHG